jgi:hypothetical protein
MTSFPTPFFVGALLALLLSLTLLYCAFGSSRRSRRRAAVLDMRQYFNGTLDAYMVVHRPLGQGRRFTVVMVRS